MVVASAVDPLVVVVSTVEVVGTSTGALVVVVTA